jgi:hypothetical protein
MIIASRRLLTMCAARMRSKPRGPLAKFRLRRVVGEPGPDVEDVYRAEWSDLLGTAASSVRN